MPSVTDDVIILYDVIVVMVSTTFSYAVLICSADVPDEAEYVNDLKET